MRRASTAIATEADAAGEHVSAEMSASARWLTEGDLLRQFAWTHDELRTAWQRFSFPAPSYRPVSAYGRYVPIWSRTKIEAWVRQVRALRLGVMTADQFTEPTGASR